MKRFTSTILTFTLITIVSSTVLAGNIPGGRAAGNIAGGRAAGNIPGGRAAGNIAGGRAATITTSSGAQVTNNTTTKFDLETSLAGSFANLIQILFGVGTLF